MRRCSKWFSILWILPFSTTSLAFFACSSDGSKGSESSAGNAGQGGDGGNSGSEIGGSSAHRGGSNSSGGSNNGGSNGTKASSSTTTCATTSDNDPPDLDGVDANCDGVDGNVSSSIFVSPDGLDSASGTKDDPVRTIGRAILLAQTDAKTRKDVLICKGTYDENVEVLALPVNLQGGYDCKTWQRTAARAVIAPPSGIALRIEGVTGPMNVTKLNIKSADATEPGESSQAVQVVTSTKIAFESGSIQSGRGAPGSDATKQTNSWGSAPGQAKAGASLIVDTDDMSVACHDVPDLQMYDDCDLDGHNDATTDDSVTDRCKTARTGGTSFVAKCPSNNATQSIAVAGGKGGNGGIRPINSAVISNESGASGTPSTALPTVATGTPGNAFGSVDATGYVVSNNGSDGNFGQPGIAGKGGNGGTSCLLRIGNVGDEYVVQYNSTDKIFYTCDPTANWGDIDGDKSFKTEDLWASYATNMGGQHREVVMLPGSGGGAGGTPGCGGYGGKGGYGGGASIALFSFDSEISLSHIDVSSNTGGKGGNPSAGTAGQPGGLGGAGGAVIQIGVALSTFNGTKLVTEAMLKGKDGTSGTEGQAGSPGGAGGGGPSVAILWKDGTKPATDGTVILKSAPGGTGGTPVSGAPGADGISADFLDAANP